MSAGAARSMDERRWVCLDIGETLVDETRVWTTWAEVLDIPVFTLAAVLGACIDRGEDHAAAFSLLGHHGWREHTEEVEQRYGGFREDDLYPDARACLAALTERGYGVAIIGNQPANRSAELRALGIEAETIAMSDELGVAKPDPAFFTAVLERTAADARLVAYVGDRVDNDVIPAAEAGLRPVWLRRGPWAALQQDHSHRAALVIEDLHELVERIDEVFLD